MAQGMETGPKPLKYASKITKRKGGTTSMQKHRFQPFSERISKLNIDSVRRKQARNTFADDDASHFLSALEEWKDRNLSESFTTFAQQVDPYCQNLPQVIHYEDEVVSLLHESLGAGDALSLEAILDLVSKFAHDLGPRFEKHFESTVQIVSRLAATHSDVAVIEWSFTCLAWLFKYLARLLVPDLRPLFDLMSQLLGKEPQKGFVTRFAAESMSYLIRKAALTHSTGTSSLDLLVRYAMDDLCNVRSGRVEQYQQGLSAMFSDAIKGVKKGVSSGAPATMKGLLDYHLNGTQRDEARERVKVVVEAVTIDVIHHTNATGFSPILHACLDNLNQRLETGAGMSVSAELLYILIGTRKGTRVADWSAVLQCVERVWNQLVGTDQALMTAVQPAIFAASVVMMQYAPFDRVLPTSQEVIRYLEDDSAPQHFLEFCNLFADLDPQRDRFNALVLPSLQKFIVTHWGQSQELLCMVSQKVLSGNSTATSNFRMPKQWQQGMAKSFSNLAQKGHNSKSNIEHSATKNSSLALLNVSLDMLRAVDAEQEVKESIVHSVVEIVQRVDPKIAPEPPLSLDFAITKGISFSADNVNSHLLPPILRSKLFSMSKPYAQKPAYLEAILNINQQANDSGNDSKQLDVVAVMPSLIDNLASASQELRTLTLDILISRYRTTSDLIPLPLQTARQIQSHELTLHNLRASSLLIRKLGSELMSSSHDEVVLKAAIAYCFGLLHIHLTPLWADACKVLADIKSIRAAEQEIVDRTIVWLSVITTSSDEPCPPQTHDAPFTQAWLCHELPNFQCTNISKLDEAIDKSLSQSRGAAAELVTRLQHDLRTIPLTTPANRMQGLLIFKSMPDLAEKRSRDLVPVLLDWALDSQEDVRDTTEASSDIARGRPTRWSRREQKTLLALFSDFVNPSVLYRSNEVYSALLKLLCNGDSDIQRAALKAVFTWKMPFVKPYETNLLNILDDARFREEITVFINVEDADGIRSEHRNELIPVLARLLYGRVVTRAGLGGSHGSQETRRKAVFQSLTKLGSNAVDAFLDIALESVSVSVRESADYQLGFISFGSATKVKPRNLLGTLRMLRELMDTLANHLATSSERVALAVMTCMDMCDQYTTESADAEDATEHASLLKAARHEGLVCLNTLFAKCANEHWIGKISGPLFDRFISPRLVNLPIETAQAPSILLKMFSTWTTHPETLHLLWSPNPTLLATIADCLTIPSAKDEVRIFVLRHVFANMLAQATESKNNLANEKLRQGSASYMCGGIIKLLGFEVSKDCLENAVRTLIDLQPFILTAEGAEELFGAALGLLTQPSRRLNPRIKGELLILIQRTTPRLEFNKSGSLFASAFADLASLFSYFRDAPNRHELVQVFTAITSGSTHLAEAAEICRQLNTYSSTRLDEPDFEIRSNAFTRINELSNIKHDPQFWSPIIHNMLFFMRDNEEIATRSGASLGLRQVVRLAASSPDLSQQFTALLDNTLLPTLQKGMKEEAELVRAEFVAVLAELVNVQWHDVGDMQPLLGSDDETSFFNNILHIQQHRRIRALHRLSAEASQISARSLSRFCLPLIENFWTDVEDDSRNLASEAVGTLEKIVENLEWQRFRALLQRLIQDGDTFGSKLKIRTLGSVVNGLYRASLERKNTAQDADAMVTDGVPPMKSLSRTLPTPDTLSKSLAEPVLAKLLEQIRYQDDASMDVRILIAFVAIRIILILPEAEIDSKLPAVLMDVCNILKSRAQDARDSARKTLADISALIGPKYFSFILRQLRTALKRGFQLHVLGYTVHSLVVSVTSKFEPGSLDYCLSDIVSIVMDSTFGHVGQEKEAQGYNSSMREFKKKAAGFETMELMSTITTLPHISKLLKPIQEQLEHPKPKVEKVDEMLRRIREGLRRNALAKNQDILTLCYEVLSQAQQHREQHSSSLRSLKMLAFGFELLRRVLDKLEDLKTPQHLEGFMGLHGIALAIEDEEVQMASMRFLSSIIKVPLKGLDEQSGNYIRMARRTIESSSSVQTMNAQAALRLVAAVLRERPAAVIKKSHFESDIAFLISKIQPDLEEPAFQGDRDRQVAAFNFLKAVMGRGVLMKEIYEVMETVREVMITSSTPPIPDLARSVYGRFVLDCFPEEGKGLSRQLDFLTSNLQYEHQRGRQSIMEVMMFLLTKCSAHAVQTVLVTFFLPLLLVSIVDQSAECRDSAENLLKKILERADKEKTQTFKTQLLSWLEPDTDQLWTSAGYKVWSLYFELHPGAIKEANVVFAAASQTITEASMNSGRSPTPLENGLVVYEAIATHFPAIAFRKDALHTWDAISRQLESSDQAVREKAAHLTSMYLANFSHEDAPSTPLPTAGSHGLQLTTGSAQDLISLHLSALDSNTTYDPTFQDFLIQNLTTLARFSNPDTNDSNLLSTILTPLTTTLRRETSSATTPPYTKLSMARLLSTLLTHLPITSSIKHIQPLLQPLHYLTTAPTPTSPHPDYPTTHAQLTHLAAELLQMFQEKLGAERYIQEMGLVQKAAREKREERGRKRALERVAEPERAERERKRRREGDKDRRRRKGAVREGGRRGW